MITSSIVDLRTRRSWELGGLIAAAFRWPTALDLFPISEFAELLAPDGLVEQGTPVITPSGIDRISGRVRERNLTYQGPVFQVHEADTGLRPGDLLVPPSPDAPILRVTASIVGAVVASSFTAIRPHSHGLWLWAVLNSHTGRRLRALARSGGFGTPGSPTPITDLTVPLPTSALSSSLEESLARIEESTHREEDEGVSSWWRVADLALFEWRLALATPHPEVIDNGVPLQNLCSEIRRGRPARGGFQDKPLPGHVPVADISVLRGGQPRRWLTAESLGTPPTLPGDVLVAAVGRWAYAMVIDGEFAVDANVYVLRLRDPVLGSRLARYLNGRTGLGVREIFTTGVTVPLLRATDLVRFPVPESALRDEGDDASLAPLDVRLERVLWN